MQLKRAIKAALAAGPLLVGLASPAQACLLVPANQQASPPLPQGPFGVGPNAPVSGLQTAAAHSDVIGGLDTPQGTMFFTPAASGEDTDALGASD